MTEEKTKATNEKLREFKAELDKESGKNAKEISGLLEIINKCTAVQPLLEKVHTEAIEHDTYRSEDLAALEQHIQELADLKAKLRGH